MSLFEDTLDRTAEENRVRIDSVLGARESIERIETLVNRAHAKNVELRPVIHVHATRASPEFSLLLCTPELTAIDLMPLLGVERQFLRDGAHVLQLACGLSVHLVDITVAGANAVSASRAHRVAEVVR